MAAAAARIAPLETVLDRLRASIAWMQSQWEAEAAFPEGMIALSPEAESQLDALIALWGARSHRSVNQYSQRARTGEEANRGEAGGWTTGAASLSSSGWIIEGAYWISYKLTTPPVISGVFCAMADIPNRLWTRRPTEVVGARSGRPKRAELQAELWAARR
jgi:hypothetical protein